MLHQLEAVVVVAVVVVASQSLESSTPVGSPPLRRVYCVPRQGPAFSPCYTRVPRILDRMPGAVPNLCQPPRRQSPLGGVVRSGIRKDDTCTRRRLQTTTRRMMTRDAKGRGA